MYVCNNNVVEELDYLVQDISLLLRVSCFIGSNHQATARKTVTIRDIWEFENSNDASGGMLRLLGYDIFQQKFSEMSTTRSFRLFKN